MKYYANDRPDFYESIINIDGKKNICYVPLPRRELIVEKVQYDRSQDREDKQTVPLPRQEVIDKENIEEGGVKVKYDESRDGEGVEANNVQEKDVEKIMFLDPCLSMIAWRICPCLSISMISWIQPMIA